MKILIADFDLFSTIGGGQSFYRSIIEKNPDLQFHYLTVSEPASADRPPNASPIPFKHRLFQVEIRKFRDVAPPRWAHRAYIYANNIAASVAGRQFDVVDFPDYEQYGMFLGPALQAHGVSCGKTALSLHGRISTTIRLNWGTEGLFRPDIHEQERLQFCTADLRYGISEDYLDEWRREVDLSSHYLHPLRFFDPPRPSLPAPSSDPPDIHFVGRTEKRKGPDAFVELASWLSRSLFGKASIIGPPCLDPQGASSDHYIRKMAERRLPDVEMCGAKSQSELSRIYARRSMTFLPSRYDTLNLIAMESLLSGCPTAVGNGAGVCRFLRDNYPEVPFVTIDMESIYSSIPEIEKILGDYDRYREELVARLEKARPEASGPTLKDIYSSPSGADPGARAQLQDWYGRLKGGQNSSPASSLLRCFALPAVLLRSGLPRAAKNRLRSLCTRLRPANIRRKLAERLLSGTFRFDAKVAHQMVNAGRIVGKYRRLFRQEESSEAKVRNKLEHCWELAELARVDRVRIWRETARLERMRGNDLLAATYELRVMRSLGSDRFGALNCVAEMLEKEGYPGEARAAQAMYGNGADATKKCTELLEEAYRGNRKFPGEKYEVVDDRRARDSYRASVIVSLYNCADKLPRFFEMLRLQRMIRSSEAEVILIDSGSPGDEYSRFKEAVESFRFPAVYVRTEERETIQNAWNRGISLSRSPYLSFIGVDEALLPDCLNLLADELDRDPGLDWVQGNSVVTQVNEKGQWLGDIMTYDRQGYSQDLVRLETCYLSWVGALYRRSIHDRHGLYDASFRAAGDTEFKGRVLPFIRSKAVPRTLGMFLNYPEGNTTLSPMAEIEDTRAWYLHRTAGGVRYAFPRKDPAEVEAALLRCLGYRKSYCGHISTDVEYARHLADFLGEIAPQSEACRYREGIAKLLESYRLLDYVPRASASAVLSALRRAKNAAVRAEQSHREPSSAGTKPHYRIFNDNRYEQHSFPWRSR